MEEIRNEVYEDTMDVAPETEVIDNPYFAEEEEIESDSGFGSNLIAGVVGGVIAYGGIKLVGKIKTKIAEKKALKEIQKTVAEAQEESEG